MTGFPFLQALQPVAPSDGSAASRLLPIIRISGRKLGAGRYVCMCMCIHTFADAPEEGRLA